MDGTPKLGLKGQVVETACDPNPLCRVAEFKGLAVGTPKCFGDQAAAIWSRNR